MILVFPLKIFSSCEIVRTWVGGRRKEECTRAFLSRNLFSNQIFLRGIFFSTTAQNTLTISVQPNARHRLGISVKNNNNLNQFADHVSLPIQINLITKLQITKFAPKGASSFRAFKKHCALLEGARGLWKNLQDFTRFLYNSAKLRQSQVFMLVHLMTFKAGLVYTSGHEIYHLNFIHQTL